MKRLLLTPDMENMTDAAIIFSVEDDVDGAGGLSDLFHTPDAGASQNLFDVLHLLAHLLDDDLHVYGAAGCLEILRLR
jgi:hypothetical protein